MLTGCRKNQRLPLRQAEFAGDHRSLQTGNTLSLQTGKRSPGVTAGMSCEHLDARSPHRERTRVSEIIRGSQAAGVKAKASATGSGNESDLGRKHMLHHIRPDAFASPTRTVVVRVGRESLRGNESRQSMSPGWAEEKRIPLFFSRIFSATHPDADGGGKEMSFRSLW